MPPDDQRRIRQVLEVVLGLAPATLFLLPFLLIGGLGMVIAAFAGGGLDWPTALLIGWALAGAVGIAALWVVFLSNDVARLGGGTRLVLTVGLLLGIAAATRWLWTTSTSGHRYGATTWGVWLVLLGGPLVVSALRLVQLWSPRRDGPAS